MSFKLIDDVDETLNTDTYYCANVVEKLFGECNNKLTYVKGGAFGFNYRYCADCYRQWDNKDLRKKKLNERDGLKGICYIKL